MPDVAHGMSAQKERLARARLGQPLDGEGVAARRNLLPDVLEPYFVVHARDQRRAEHPLLLERNELAVGNRAAPSKRKITRRSSSTAHDQIVHDVFL